ncbi:unnamed protein product, partial [Durusdinium trenchii]
VSPRVDPPYMASTRSSSQRLVTRSPGASLRAVGRSASLQSFTPRPKHGSGRRASEVLVLHLEEEATWRTASTGVESKGSHRPGATPVLEELQTVQKRLFERFAKLDEGLRAKDVQLEKLSQRLLAAESLAAERLQQARDAQEEVQVLKRALAAKAQELERLKGREHASDR